MKMCPGPRRRRSHHGDCTPEEHMYTHVCVYLHYQHKPAQYKPAQQPFKAWDVSHAAFFLGGLIAFPWCNWRKATYYSYLAPRFCGANTCIPDSPDRDRLSLWAGERVSSPEPVTNREGGEGSCKHRRLANNSIYRYCPRTVQ